MESFGSSKSRKNKQCNGDKNTNNDLQNSTQKTKHWTTRTQYKMEMNSRAPGEQAVFTPLVAAVM